MYRDYISSDEPYINISPCTEIILVLMSLTLIYLQYRDYISSDEPYINISPCTEIILVLMSLRLIYLHVQRLY